MKKNIVIITSVILLIFIGGLASYFIFFDKKEVEPPIEPLVETKLDKLQKILESSEYFVDAKYQKDEKLEKLTIDQKYEISIKSGYYLMNIKNTKDEEVYCNIVDAVEMSLGTTKGESLNTCKETLKGSINLGGINVEFFDTYKILTVNSEEVSKFYTPEKSRTEGELISIDEINYDIQIGNSKFTSMSTGYSEDIKLFNICGHSYNAKNKEEVYRIKIYDENKAEIANTLYSHSNDNKRYKTFCTEFELNINNVKYYSITKEEE